MLFTLVILNTEIVDSNSDNFFCVEEMNINF